MDDRFATLLRLHKEQPGGKVVATTGADGEKSGEGEDMKVLLNDVDYVALHTAVLSKHTTGSTMGEIVALVASHVHPAGLVLMTTARKIDQPAWRGLKGLKLTTSWQAAFDRVLAINTDGVAKPDWGYMLPMAGTEPKLAAVLLKHRLSDVTDWHTLCLKWVEHAKGPHVLADPRYAGSAGVNFWLNADIMRLDSFPMKAIFGLIGHGQSRSVKGSFHHFYDLQMDRAETIYQLPGDIVGTNNVKVLAKEAVLTVLKDATDVHAAMMLQPFHMMRRELFVSRDAQKLLDGVDEQIAELRVSVEQALKGRAKHQMPHLQSVGGGQFPPPPPPMSTAGSSSVYSLSSLNSAGGMLSAGGASVAGSTGVMISASGSQWQQHDPASHLQPSVYPQGVFLGWGDMACARGVWRTPFGLAFGMHAVELKKNITIPQGCCVAVCAPNSSAVGRSKWCVTPQLCATFGAHERVEGTDNDDYPWTQIDESSADRSQWQAIVAPNPACVVDNKQVPAPTPPWGLTNPRSGDGRGRGGARDGGRGASGGKGKGERKGRGGGGGKGKGKPMAGQKRPNFEWQPAGHKAISSPPALLGTDRPHAGLTIEASDAKRTNALLHSIEPRADARPPPTPPKPIDPNRSPSPLPRAAQKPRSPSPSAAVGGILKPATVLTGLLAQAGATTALPLPTAALAAPAESMNLFPAGLELFPREHAFPFSADFVWPRLDYFALHEHSGEFREAWTGASCSVANRPTNQPPGEGKFHFVMDVYHFVAVYPYPLGIVTTGVECTFSTWANHTNWQLFIAEGTMARKADEMLYAMYLGARNASEHPPSAFEAIIGEPSFQTHTFMHGPADDSTPVFAKTVHWYTRHLLPVLPTREVPVDMRRDRPSHSDADVRMVIRSTMTAAFAAAHVATWDVPPHDVPDGSRPAWMPGHGYAAHRRLMICNLAAFSCYYAPTALLTLAERPRMLVAVPIGFGPAPSGNDALCTLVRHDGLSFCQPLRDGEPLLAQMQELARYLPCGEQPQQMHVTRDAVRDIIFALPVTFMVAGAVSDLAEAPRRRNLHACWCTAEALGSDQYVHALLAVERARSLTSPVPWLRANIGATDGPVPITPNRSAARYRSLKSSPEAAREWVEFLRAEEARGLEFAAAFEAADNGSGLLASFIGNFHTAFTRAAELTPPPQGLPALDVATLSLAPYPDPPAPLHTSYLARLPPQSIPDGFPESLAYQEVIRRWGRRHIAECINMTAAHDFDCVLQGWSDKPRHPFVCLGHGAFKRFHLVDGIGSVSLSTIILSVGNDGRLRPMAFEHLDHKDLNALVGIMGFSTDKELMSFLIHGNRWKVEWPRQIRFSHNVMSLKTRAAGVGDATAKLIDKGLYVAAPVMTFGETLTEDSPCPLVTTPQYAQGMGGQDKVDSVDEKRPTANNSDPHSDVHERNSPHGEPDGPLVVSVNDLTGLKKYPPGYDGYIPFPDKETKTSSREVYAHLAINSALAAVNGTTPGASKDDVRWMFFQFYNEPCEWWTTIEYLVIRTCSRCGCFSILCKCTGDASVTLVLYKVMPRVMNMGLRPASKLAVRFSKEINAEWRCRMADYVQAQWLPRQTQALRDVLDARERRLGYDQAHPFGCFEFTDDFLDFACDIPLCAHGALTRRKIAKEINLWMSAKNEAGTCVDYIGGRNVLTGNFGTLTAEKRLRCVDQCTQALNNLLSLDDFVANNSYLVHVKDLLNLDPTLLEGNWAPCNKYPFGNMIVCLTGPASHPEFARVVTNYKAIRIEVATRPAAAFTTGLFDAPRGAQANPGAQVTMYLRMSSDCMANGVQTVISGSLLEFEWTVDLTALDARWAKRHVNVGESTGASVNVAVFGKSFHMFELVQEGDNMVEGPMLLGRSRSSDQRNIGQALRETPGFQAACERLWFEHSSGLGLGFADAGSRLREDVQANLAAAYGKRRTRLDVLLDPDILALLSKILDATTEYVKRPRATHLRRVRFAPTAADLRARRPEETGRGTCPSAEFHNSGSQVASLSPTPPRRGRTPLSSRPAPAPPPASPLPLPASGLSPTPPRPPPMTSTDRVLRSPPALAPSPEHAARDARDGSPQPLTAAAARAAAALEDADVVVSNAAPSKRVELRSLCSAAHASEMNGIPRGTRSADEWGFKKVKAFAQHFGLRWMRPRFVPEEKRREEDKFAALALFHIVPLMQPAPRTLAKGITQAMPPSGILAVYGWRRVMRDCGRHQPDMAAAGRQLRGMIHTLKLEFGQNAMSVDHHIPYPLQSVIRAVRYLDNHCCKQWSAQLHDSLSLIVKFSMVRGPRLDEWCEMFSGDSFYRRSNFSWSMGNDVLGSTQRADAHSTITDGTIVRCMNVPSKTDRSGSKWLGKFMWYVVDSANPLNFAAAWARYERRYPCPEGSRAVWPAFSPEASALPFKPTKARALLRHLWTEVEGEAFASIHWWHDFRATIATAHTAEGKPPAFTQAMVCWASPASVALYGQMKPADMAKAAEDACRVDASRHAHVVTPHHSTETVAAELARCAAHLSASDSSGKETAKNAKKKAVLSTAAAVRPTSAAATTKRTRATSPPPLPSRPSPPSPKADYDVGPPLGAITVTAGHSLDGATVHVLNSQWDASANGRTACTIIGFCPSAELGKHRGVFVVRDDTVTALTHYAFTAAALRPSLPAPLRKKLPATHTPATQAAETEPPPRSTAPPAIAAGDRTPAKKARLGPQATAAATVPSPCRRSPRVASKPPVKY